ncbi:MAG: M1 family aminopeptidase [Bryobacteraceae bacterium]
MFQHFLGFELRYWLRGWMVWIFFLIISLMIFGACSSDKVTVGESIGNTFRNAPFVIQNYYAIMAVLTLLMTTAFVNSAAIRDFQYNTNQMLFSLPVSKSGYIMGRYLGASIAAMIPPLGVTLGVIAAKYAPWVEAERFGGISWSAHLNSVLVFVIPNTLFVAAVLFAVAALFRSTTVSFLGGLLLLVAYGVTAALTSDLKNEALAAMVDPFGAQAFTLMTKYWTVAERNSRSVGFEGILLWNRLLWLGVGAVVLGLASLRITLGEMPSRKRKAAAEEDEQILGGKLPWRTPSWSGNAALQQWMGTVRIEFASLIKTPAFLVIAAAALLNCIVSTATNVGEAFGNKSFPVTYAVTQLIQGSLYMFLVALLTYFAGQLVWRERDDRVDEIHDSLPVRDWVLYAAKLVVLLVGILLILGVSVAAGMIVQTAKGYTRFQLDVYAHEIFLRDFSLFIFLSVLAFLFHIVSPNKYIGYFAFIAFLIADLFGWPAVNVASRMVSFGARPQLPYSEFFGFAPAMTGWLWFTLYWSLFCVLLAGASLLLWPRGKEIAWKHRLRVASLRMEGWLRPAMIVTAIAFCATGAWAFYNTKVLNTVIGPKDGERLQADYEKTYKKFQHLPQPRISNVRYQIDLFPETREATMRATETITNRSNGPIAELHFTMDRQFDYEIQPAGASVKLDDTRLHYRIYSLNPPMQPGEARTLTFTVKAVNRGFANSVERQELVQNGTFFNNTVAPQIGYQERGELTDRNDRRNQGLGEKDLMPALERNCTAHCMDTYLSNNSDWTSVETVISTVADQIAIAPGSLQREWSENGRRYFQYKLDKDSLNFYSFMSARYEVVREEWNGIKLEVYYLPQHKWNVPRMMESMKKSLGYFTKNFGPYYHKEARIIEFPRIARFAQAFPGTMPYSEGIGFIADLSDKDSIDQVFYIVAHEMGHQWWAHQVVGANMQGATLLSETMAQYSALMVMEKEYGRDIMRKFLEYEMDRYLRSRGRERLKERPLLNVEAEQGYIHYRKGSVNMYLLKETIGEEAINRVLRKLVQQYAYADAPYPTSYALVDALKEEAGPQNAALLRDLFEDITLFSNRTMKTTAKKLDGGKYEVTVKAEAKKFKADAGGAEREVPIDDWVEFGAFAAPPKGQKYGKTLYRERVHVTSGDVTRTFTVSELPEKAGIDPFHLLIDRTPDDNLKSVEIR